MLVAQLCPTLCDPMDCSPPGSSVHWMLLARILEWGAMPFSRGIFPLQGLNLGLLHCRQILYLLSHQGSPFCRGGGEYLTPRDAVSHQHSGHLPLLLIPGPGPAVPARLGVSRHCSTDHSRSQPRTGLATNCTHLAQT